MRQKSKALADGDVAAGHKPLRRDGAVTVQGRDREARHRKGRRGQKHAYKQLHTNTIQVNPTKSSFLFFIGNSPLLRTATRRDRQANNDRRYTKKDKSNMALAYSHTMPVMAYAVHRYSLKFTNVHRYSPTSGKIKIKKL
jgi:hypothetical protein